MPTTMDSPPRAPPVQYKAPLGTRWEKEKAAAGNGAFDYPDDAKFVGPWIIGECVGKGASGHVKIAKHRRTGQLAAVKILPLQPFVNSRTSQQSQAKTEKQRLGIDREITMMKLMNHPNIMRIYDVYEGDKELYLILEYVEGGELFDFLVNRGKLPPLEALGYFKQIVYGLNYAHTFSIIHRDLKPENILIHSLDPPLVKIADWGMAAFAPPTLQLETSCGSPHYASPEIVNGHRYTGTATDIWSCGVILYALLTGRLPFDDKNVRTLLGKVKAGRYEVPAYIDPLARDLLTRMLVVDVRKRITMSEILTHPWLDGHTPGITYVPAPPVSELARPLQSVQHIDRDLFQSLCVIWGRHADIESIKADLLSPEGEGILAKAFYFLLLKHRERAMEEHGILMDDILKSPGKVVVKQYSTPKSRFKAVHPEPLGSKPAMLPVRASRPTSVISTRTPSPQPPSLQISVKPVLERASAREHPPSPIGPRPPRSRPMSSPVGESRFNASYLPAKELRDEIRSSSRPTSQDSADTTRFQMSDMLAALPQIQSPHVYRRSAILASGAPRTSLGLSPLAGGQTSRTSETGTSNSPAFIHAPIPVLASQAKILPMITAPRVQDAELQKTFDRYANMVNAQAHNWNTTRGHLSPAAHTAQSSLAVDFERPRRPTVELEAELRQLESEARRSEEKAIANKENVEQVHNPKKRPLENSSANTGGLGFGTSVPIPISPMSKEMVNVMYMGASDSKEKKKHRPCALDLGSSALQKRATFPAVGSPTPMSPPPSTLLGSPAVGEFKGWFSNLFHWKVQSYLLYSIDDVGATRLEVHRLLELLGISIIEDHQYGLFKCRVDDMYDGSAHVQKSMRFRVEISSTSNYIQGGTPRLSQSAMSPQMSSMAALRSRSQFDKVHGYESIAALILEKGSLTTFKNVFHRMKGEWALDSLQSPTAGGGAPTSLDQRIMA